MTTRLPEDLAPAQRARVFALLAEVTPVQDRPEVRAETHDSRERCAHCNRRGGPLLLMRPDKNAHPDVTVLVHPSCRRAACKRRRRLHL